MANLGNMYVNIGANTAMLRGGLLSAERSISSFAARSSKQLSGLARGFGLLGAAAGGALAAFATAAVIKKSISEFVAFEDAVLDLQKVMQDSEGTVKDYMGTVNKLSSTFASSAVEVLQGAANFKQAGFAVKEAFELQEKALTLTKISELDVNEASGMLISTLKGFKAPASETTRLIDGMNEVSNNYATSLGQLATGMSRLAPIARTMGFSFEETAGILTPIIEVFRSGSEAANAMKLVLIRLTGSNKNVRDALHSLGVSQTHFNGRLKSGKQLLTEVQKAFQNLADEQKIVVAGQLAGARQAARATVVFDGLAQTTDVTTTAMNSQGSAQKELDIRLKSLGIRLKNTQIAFQNMFITMGTELAPAIGEGAEVLTKFIDSLGESGVVTAFGKSLGFLTQQFVNLTKSVVDTTGLFEEVQEQWADWFIGLFDEGSLLAPFKKLVPWIRQIPDELELAEQSVEGLTKALKNMPEEVLSEQMKSFLYPGPMLPDTVIKVDASQAIWAMGEYKKAMEEVRAIQLESFAPIIGPVQEFGIVHNVRKEMIVKDMADVSKAFADLELLSQGAYDRMAKKSIDTFETIFDKGKETPERLAIIWNEKVSKMFDGEQLTGEAQEAFQFFESMFGDTMDEMVKEAKKLEDALLPPLDKAMKKIARIQELSDMGAFSAPDVAPKLIAEVKANLPDQKEADRLHESLMNPLEIYEAGVKRLKELGPLVNATDQARQMERLSQEYKENLKNMGKDTINFQTIATKAIDMLGDAMGDLMLAAWEGDMDAFAETFRAFVKSINKMVMDELGKKLVTGIFGDLLSGSKGTGGGGSGGGSGGGLLSFIGGLFHNGGIVTMHNGGVLGGLKQDERIVKAQTGEGFLSRKDMARIGGAAGFNRLRGGDGASSGDTNISVPVNVEGNNKLAGELQKGIEQTVIKIIREYA